MKTKTVTVNISKSFTISIDESILSDNSVLNYCGCNNSEDDAFAYIGEILAYDTAFTSIYPFGKLHQEWDFHILEETTTSEVLND
jgi:hypothetical protein